MTGVQLQCTKCMTTEFVWDSMMPTFRSPSQRRDAIKEEMVCACNRFKLAYIGRPMSKLRRLKADFRVDPNSVSWDTPWVDEQACLKHGVDQCPLQARRARLMAVMENYQTNLVRNGLPCKAFDQDRTDVWRHACRNRSVYGSVKSSARLERSGDPVRSAAINEEMICARHRFKLVNVGRSMPELGKQMSSSSDSTNRDKKERRQNQSIWPSTPSEIIRESPVNNAVDDLFQCSFTQ